MREFADVQPDMVLEGVVTNVTKFGAFVDIGVHQDGLVHISELSNKFIKDPFGGGEGRPDREGEGAERGHQDQAHCAVDEAADGSGQGGGGRPAQGAQGSGGGANRQQQASSSSRPQGGPQGRPQGGSQSKPQAAQKPATMEEKLAMLSSKWKVS